VALAARHLPSAERGELELLREQLAVDKARVRGALAPLEHREVRVVRRRVHGAQRRGERWQSVTATQLFREVLGRRIGGERRERHLEQASHRGRTEAGKTGVDRHDAAGAGLAAGGFERRIDQLEQPRPEAARRAVEDHTVAVRIPLEQIGLIEPGDRERSPLTDEAPAHDHEAPAARAHEPELGERSGDGPDARRSESVGCDHPAAVLVAQGKMEQKVPHGVEVEIGEPVGASRSDAAQETERRVAPWGGGSALGGRGHAPRKTSATSPQRTSSPELISAGTPVSSRTPLRNVPFIVPISSTR
jgi:hypothetical protein